MTAQSVFIVTCGDDKRFHDRSSRMFLAPSLLWLSHCLHLCYKAGARANIPPPSPPPPSQLSASDSDPNLSGIPSSWSACWAVPNAQTLGAAPTLTEACLDYLHPCWCNPVLDCRMSILPSYFICNPFCPGEVCWECTLFSDGLGSFSHCPPGQLQL